MPFSSCLEISSGLAVVEVTDKLVFLVDICIVAVLLVAIVKVVSTSDAFFIVAITLEVVNLVTGLIEVEIEMLDGHVRSL